MTTVNLTIICDEVDSLTPMSDGQGSNTIKLILDDVDADHLLTQLSVKCDAHTILDHLSDDDIADYVEARNSAADMNNEDFPF